jgi:hypothetical protein
MNKVIREESNLILSRQINAEQKGSNLVLSFKYGDFDAEYILRNATTSQFNELLVHFRDSRNLPGMNKADAVVTAFFKAFRLWSKINPSDLWWFVVSRLFLDPYNHPASEMHRDLAQSWKRTSGWALERVFVKHYSDHLRKHHILMDTFSDNEKRQLLEAMRLKYALESAKADVLLVNLASGKRECFGVVHVKASIAERRQNDQSFSKALRDKNYFSPFMTMDCKSFPGAKPINKGEFGEPLTIGKDGRTDKRKEFEEEGYFSACFSYNKNTKPTLPGQKAAARIYQMNFSDPDDDFSRLVIAARNRLYED